jgi:hypothetical protein
MWTKKELSLLSYGFWLNAATTEDILLFILFHFVLGFFLVI